MKHYILWKEWSEAFFVLRGAFSRQTTFFWVIIACAGMTIRTDRIGVTSIVRALGLTSASYLGLLRAFHSDAINLDKLLELWVELCLRIFKPACVDGFMLIIGDGIKVAKEGRKMPAVKSLHQDSQSNAKAEFIMGHYLQAFSLAVVSPIGRLAAIPLVAQIHDGIVYSNRSTITIIDKFMKLFSQLVDITGHPAILVADAYYAASSVVHSVLSGSCHLVTRVQHNTVAYHLPIQPGKNKRGRPPKYGEKVRLSDLFFQFDDISTQFEDCRYYCINLVWKPVKQLVRFVIIEHETKGRCVVMTTHLTLDPITIIKIYRLRWMIETGFKQAIHVIGTFSYHFWMKSMEPIRRRSKGQWLHRKSIEYRHQVERKLKAFHVHVMLGCICQGLALHLAINFRNEVWSSFSGWLRTMRKNQEPSEMVVANALTATLPNFLQATKEVLDWRKFLLKRIDLERQGPMSRTG